MQAKILGKSQVLDDSQASSNYIDEALLKVSVLGFDVPELAAIRNLLYPFKVEFVAQSETSDVTIGRDQKPEFRKLIIVPHAESKAPLENVHEGSGIATLPYDIVSICVEKFETVMNPKISPVYNLTTRLPFDYNIVPSSIRSRVLKTQQRQLDTDLLNHLSVEVARSKLVESFEKLGFKLVRKGPSSIIITHDIDTEKGLERAASLKQVERDFGIKSTWFVVSEDYQVPRKIAKELAEGSEIGSHDVKHDGRLIHLRKQENLVKRLKRSKEKLTEVFEREITSFRAPLLQFNGRIISAIGKAGYENDFSLPCWEPMHPSTMQGFGVEAAYEFEIEGVAEHPLTLFQDHQVLKGLGLSTSEAVRFWLEQIRLIRSFDGDIVLLVHPDYSFSEDLQSYRKLLESISILNVQQQVELLSDGS